jgi:hypothetical protein
VSTGGRAGRPDVRVRFDPDVWEEEVERLRSGSQMRQAAVATRRALETRRGSARWLACEAEGPRGTRLVGCVKVYLPRDREASAAPYGFVFELVVSDQPEPALELRLLAFGERHPEGSATRSVYERAHKRLHGRYPDQ